MQPLGNHFQSQDHYTGNLSSNNHSPTQIDCNHPQIGEGLQTTAI